MMNKISYELFRSRRNFNPIILFQKKNDLTLEEFNQFFESFLVCTPGKEYYEKVKQTFFLKYKKEIDIIEETELKQLEIKNEEHLYDQQLDVKHIKQKRKRKVKNDK